jgi:diaminopropionate ammonia-lyase
VSFGFKAVLNPLARADDGRGVGATRRTTSTGGGAVAGEVLAFHRRLPGYEPTSLLSLPRLASQLDIRELLVKVEAGRFGLPSFKLLGASWATYRAVRERLAQRAGTDTADVLGEWADIDELTHLVKPLLPFRLAAATDGNHGRAVARMARWLGFDATVFVPAGTTGTRIGAIESEGAKVVVVPGSYDDAVARAAREAGPRCLVINDTSGPGYVDVPRWVADGYGTMFVEVDDALARAGHRPPGAVLVPIGVGALAAASVSHFRNRRHPVHVIGVEPTGAASTTASALAGHLVTVPDPHSIMAGLNCGTPSPVAWPLVAEGAAGFVTIDDDWVREAVRAFAACGVEAGETGAAALGGLMALQRQGRATPLARLLGEGASVLVLATEGASDVVAWRAIVGAELVG